MPERFVEMLREENGKIIVRIPGETARYANLEGKEGEYLLVDLVKVFDPHLKLPTHSIGEKAICRTVTFRDNRGYEHLGLEIPQELVNDYGMKAGEYLEAVIEHAILRDKIAAVYPNLEILNQYPYWWRKISQ
ncbi:hypothetical protein [Thermoplasma acidophilum]|uniref:Uncharacterized protein n=1 Tax=Thermoplasma acidophilum (strain ATCC 25905 / DSM 1728 / JCM 9062 / NBRC 15155 / AMRC-C165) TaxID=273075 RepID=Q9HL32_THEAC|nr:hypothetical protein [Thermoplasma acidophilum]MCY0851289.1 hypothetical protein [Thermoplasma acidophilum]CAC11550.1 hypothetical protein [Thermoplasma acidophilum]